MSESSLTGSSPLEAERPVLDLIKVGSFKKIYDQSIGEEEEWYINDHCIILGHDGLWHMFGITNTEPFNPGRERYLAHATASDLTQVPWKKEPYAVTADFEKWKEYHLWAPAVVRHEGLYYMYVCVGSDDNRTYKIHLLTSEDLYNWTRHAENPVIADGYDARDPDLIRLDDGRWVMYYTATSSPEGGKHIVAAVTSRDLVHWKDRQVVFTDVEEGTFGGPTESPFVLRRGKYYYLFICNNDRRRGYDATDVYRSENPFHWDFEDWVGAYDAHASEPVQDLDGQWYVTHCGWSRGGLYLAPMQWLDEIEE